MYLYELQTIAKSMGIKNLSKYRKKSDLLECIDKQKELIRKSNETKY